MTDYRYYHYAHKNELIAYDEKLGIEESDNPWYFDIALKHLGFSSGLMNLLAQYGFNKLGRFRDINLEDLEDRGFKAKHVVEIKDYVAQVGGLFLKDHEDHALVKERIEKGHAYWSQKPHIVAAYNMRGQVPYIYKGHQEKNPIQLTSEELELKKYALDYGAQGTKRPWYFQVPFDNTYLQLPLLTYNILKNKCKIKFLGDITELELEELKKCRGFGDSGIYALETVSKGAGLWLAEDHNRPAVIQDRIQQGNKYWSQFPEFKNLQPLTSTDKVSANGTSTIATRFSDTALQLMKDQKVAIQTIEPDDIGLTEDIVNELVSKGLNVQVQIITAMPGQNNLP